MSALTKSWLGRTVPKQYCTFVGNRSMLRHTIDRLRGVVRPEHLLTVIGPGHESHLTDALQGSFAGKIVSQPVNCDTAPGIFLPATFALAADPEATLVVLPSDHYVYPEARFQPYLQRAIRLAEQNPDRIILLGALPDRPELDYGWIKPRARVRHASCWAGCPVASFREKPVPEDARTFFREGWLWNTLILVVKGRTLWELGEQHLPRMMQSFGWLRNEMPVGFGRVPCAECEREALASVYTGLPPVDFSRDVLEKSVDRALVLPMAEVQWSDWGKPERIAESLERIGKRPLFQTRLAEAPPGSQVLPISA